MECNRRLKEERAAGKYKKASALLFKFASPTQSNTALMSICWFAPCKLGLGSLPFDVVQLLLSYVVYHFPKQIFILFRDTTQQKSFPVKVIGKVCYVQDP